MCIATMLFVFLTIGLCYCPNDCNYMCDPQPQLTDIYANGDSLHIEWTTPANQNHDVYFVEYIEIDHPDNIIDADCSTLTRNYSSSIGITSGSVSIAFQNVSSNSVYLFRIAHHSGEYTTRTSYCFTFEYNMNVPMYEKEGNAANAANGDPNNFCIHEVPFCNSAVPSVMISNQNCLLAYNNCINMEDSNCRSTNISNEVSIVCDELCLRSLIFENNVKILATCDITSSCQEVETFCNGSALRVPLWRAKFNHHQSVMPQSSSTEYILQSSTIGFSSTPTQTTKPDPSSSEANEAVFVISAVVGIVVAVVIVCAGIIVLVCCYYHRSQGKFNVKNITIINDCLKYVKKAPSLSAN